MVFARLLTAAGKRWWSDSIPRFSAALAYYTFFSMAPLLAISVAVCGIFFGRDAAEGRLQATLQSLVGPDTARAVQEVVRSAWKPGTGFLAVLLGLFALFMGATGVLNELRGALNSIWKAGPKSGVKPLVLGQTRLIGFILGVGFLLLVSLLFSALIAALGRRFQLPLPEALLQAFNFLADLAMSTCIFAAIFRWLPDIKLAWRFVWTGAALTAVLFMGGKFLMGLYLGKSALVSVYGAAASLVMLLVWVYYSAIIFYFGAEFTKALSENSSSGPGRR